MCYAFRQLVTSRQTLVLDSHNLQGSWLIETDRKISTFSNLLESKGLNSDHLRCKMKVDRNIASQSSLGQNTLEHKSCQKNASIFFFFCRGGGKVFLAVTFNFANETSPVYLAGKKFWAEHIRDHKTEATAHLLKRTAQKDREHDSVSFSSELLTRSICSAGWASKVPSPASSSITSYYCPQNFQLSAIWRSPAGHNAPTLHEKICR